MGQSLKVFNVTPQSGARTVAVQAESRVEALRLARQEFQHNAKLRAKHDDAIKVGSQPRAVHSNKGIEQAYRRALMQLIAEMHGSVQHWITAGYRKNPPKMETALAQDAAYP
jgi:hypothetical protein